jgi:arylsulfatase A-like enzyme
MTGQYPARVGITQFIGGQYCGRLQDVPYLHYLPLEHASLARALGEGGYQTWHVGKWHLGDEAYWPQQHGFDINIGGSYAGSPRTYWSPWRLPNLDDGEPGRYLSDALTDQAIALIRQRDPSRPFFMHLSHYAVHTPIQSPPALVAKYQDKARARKLDRVQALVDGELVPKIFAPGQRPERVRRRLIQSDPAYAAMIENLDANIGRVIQTLDDQGIADDTIVVFTSDNGGLATTESSPTCNLPLAEGKGWNLEGGTRVCQIVRWPRVVRPGSVCATPTTSTDYYPTFLEAAGLPLRPAQHCDGVSLMPLLCGGQGLGREAIYWHYPHYSNQGGTPAASMVSGRWKLIEYFEDGRMELYDLERDVSETRNLAADQPDVTRHLRGMLRAWQRDVSAQIPTANPDWERLRPALPNNAHE